MALPPTADREADDALWRELTGRTGEAPAYSPVYRMRLSGAPPTGLVALPKDQRPPHTERGQAIMQGRWRFGSSHVECDPDHAPWGPPFPSLHFADRIHRFHWLRDVASQGHEGESKARSLAVSWVQAFGKWDPFAWRLGVTADRLVNLLSAGPWLLGGLDDATRETVLDSMARQARHLLTSGSEETDPLARFRIAVAMTLSGATMEGMHRILDAGLALLETECGAQILADGGLACRSPEQLAEALLDVQAVEDLLLRLGMNAPAFLTRLQPRMASMLGFFTLADGGLLVANGGGDGEHGLSQAALRPYGQVSSKFSFARLSAYQRVQAEDLTVFFDAGAGPDRPHGVHAHAGALAISVDDGPERIITQCAANPDLDPVLRDASRRSAAHSVLSLNGEDSAVFVPDQATGVRAPEGPAAISVRRLEENDQYLLEGQHGGWRVRHGVIYRRRLYVSKDGVRITGEDSLSRPMSETSPALATAPIPYSIRFHLHPDVQIAPGPDDRTVFLGLSRRQRIWRFRSEALLRIESSRYWGGGAARKTQQLVVLGEADPRADGSEPPNRVRWALSRVEPGVQGG
jgi:uncharacterized heparinase superfamily protein